MEKVHGIKKIDLQDGPMLILQKRGFKRLFTLENSSNKKDFFKKAFSTYLKRANKTLNVVLDYMDLDWTPVEKTRRLNEKHYGMLQGLNKAETARKNIEKHRYLFEESFDVAAYSSW